MNTKAITLLSLLSGCSMAEPMIAMTGGQEDDSRNEMAAEAEYYSADGDAYGYADKAAPAAPPAAQNARRGAPGAGSGTTTGYLSQLSDEPMDLSIEEEEKEGRDDGIGAKNGRDGSAEVVTRAWFPETFLFEPQVVTDEAGKASVTVTVPDRLTEWRVLGLAHAKSGAVAGDTLRFQGTLPIYVDPVVPAFLRAGDQLSLPVQVVNTTAKGIRAPLSVSATGVGYVEGAPGTVDVAGGRNAVRTVSLSAERAGAIVLRASVGEEDAVEHTIPVQPTGRPLSDDRSGTLASPRSYTLSGPFDAEAGSTRARLVVYPGALAVLRSELSRVEQRSGVANDAYALMLAGRGPKLLADLDGEVDAEALRELRLVSTQRVLRATRSPDLAHATLLAEAALSSPDAPVLARLGNRMVDQILSAQRPDGTFAGGNGWTVQRLLVATAESSAALSRSQALADDSRRQAIRRGLLRANSAYERLSPQTDDAYTAAAILAGGNVEGELADTLRARVRGAIVTSDDGSRSLPVPEGVVRADGVVPTRVEATALAALALADDPEADAWRADLGATLLSAYSPGRGWGSGRASLTCLQAVLSLFDTPLPAELAITLEQDGVVIAEGSYDREKLREVLVLDAIGLDAAGTHEFSVRAEPAVAGLGFALSLQSWVPWEEPAADQGLEAALTLPERMIAGQPAELALQAAAPSRTPFTIEHHLPAGVQADTDSLDALVSDGVLRSYHTEDGLIRMEAAALDPGEALNARYVVIPTLGGSLSSGPLSLYPDTQPALTVHYPPAVWSVL